MSKYATYLEIQKTLKDVQKKAESLADDPEVQKVIAFGDKLSALMEEYAMTQSDVLAIWGLSEKPSVDKRRASRPMKTYTNPETGEVVKTRGGNHKVLNAWRSQYGKEAVDSWREA